MTRSRGRGDGEAPVWRWNDRTQTAAACARTALRCALKRVNLPTQVVDDATRAAWELIANAMEHACGPYEMRLCRDNFSLLFEIEDGDPSIPQLPISPSVVSSEPEAQDGGGSYDALIGALSERGRGLCIVDQFTGGRWGFRASRSGIKVAWMAINERAQTERHSLSPGDTGPPTC
ncbi:ATP-binding protein [Streptomyces sp. DSM 41524]|uniref:ATP-binding protein n=1 Tax=Streptomyces asiaticus subsp. ignotus TaxID=3098222 RepID=A0ABU7QEM9_9ACTN|nr:ATP-binding protein [Streptomyces sp. DSM 41524]